MQSGRWDHDAAESLEAQARSLCALVVDAGRRDLAESLLSYAVYLGTFVSSAQTPNADQTRQLKVLAEVLAESVERWQQRAPSIDLLNEAQAARSSTPEVCLVGIDSELAEQIAAALQPLGLASTSMAKVADQVRKLRQGEIAAAAVDQRALGAWQQLLNKVGGGESGRSRPPTLGVGGEDRLEWQLEAMRSGAEGCYVLPAQLSQLARRLADLADIRSTPYRVLIVDDDPSITEFCEAVLSHNGIQVRTCNEPMSVFSLLADFRPEVIVLDMYMPEVNGLELLKLLRSNAQTMLTPVIVLSADDDAERRFDALHLGGDDYLTKPIRPRFLVAAVTGRARRARWVQQELTAQRTG